MNAEHIYLSSTGWVIAIFGVIVVLLSIPLILFKSSASSSLAIKVPGVDLHISGLGLSVLVLGLVFTFGPRLSSFLIPAETNVMVYESQPERVISEYRFLLTSYYEPFIWSTDDFYTQATHTSCDRNSKLVTCDTVRCDGEPCIEIGFPDLHPHYNWNWLGVYWLPPDHIWKDKLPSRLEKAQFILFSRKSKNSTTLRYVDSFVGGIYPDKKFRDNFEFGTGPLQLTDKFQDYTVSLSDRDLTSLVGAFAIKVSKGLNPELSESDKLYITIPKFQSATFYWGE